MKIFDSGNLPVQATSVGAVITLVSSPQGTAVPDKTITQTGNHITVSNSVLEFSGRRYTGGSSTLTLSGVVTADSLSIGGKVYTAGTEFAVGGSDTITASNLAAAINTIQFVGQAAFLFNSPNLNVDAKVTGTGAVASSVTLEHSVNGVDWVTFATLACSGTNSDLKSALGTSPKPFIRATPTTLTGTVARVQVWVSPVYSC